MHKGRAAIVGTLIVGAVLGTVAAAAIYRTAGRRAGLVDEIAARVPEVPRARLLARWEPATGADEAHATYCLDDADPRGAATRFTSALTAAGWKVDFVTAGDGGRAVAFELSSDAHRLRGVAGPGVRPGCDGSRRQAALTVQAARLPR